MRVLAATVAIALVVGALFIFGRAGSQSEGTNRVSVEASEGTAVAAAQGSRSVAPPTALPVLRATASERAESYNKQTVDPEDLPQEQPSLGGRTVPTLGGRNPLAEIAMSQAEARQLMVTYREYQSSLSALDQSEVDGTISTEEHEDRVKELQEKFNEKMESLLGVERAQIFAEAAAAWGMTVVGRMKDDAKGGQPFTLNEDKSVDH